MIWKNYVRRSPPTASVELIIRTGLFHFLVSLCLSDYHGPTEMSEADNDCIEVQPSAAKFRDAPISPDLLEGLVKEYSRHLLKMPTLYGSPTYF
jgi:hypothetical protein